MRLIYYTLLLAALAAVLFLAVAYTPQKASRSEPAAVQTLAIPKPTGATFNPGPDQNRNTVIVIGKHGQIGEFETGATCRQLVSPITDRNDLDLQGVTVDPLTGYMYVVDQARYLIYEIDIDVTPARVRRVFELQTKDVPQLRQAGLNHKGLSGICFLPPQGRERGGRFILSHQDGPAGLIEVELPLAQPTTAPASQPIAVEFVNWYDFGTPDLTEVTYDSATRTLLVLSGMRRELLWVSLDGRLLGNLKLPKAGMNGLALLPDRRLFIALAEGGVQWLGPQQWRDTLPSSSRIDSVPMAEEPPGPPPPYYTVIQRLANDEMFPYKYTRQGFRKWLPNGWIVFGFGAQFLFMMRFVVQWLVSEKKKRVVVPVVFWYISLLGSFCILIYALRDFRPKDIVFVAGQLLACAIYVRNLMLAYRHKASEEPADQNAAVEKA